MTLSDRIRAVLPHLNDWERNTLKSMRENAKAYAGTLTDKQVGLVNRIIADATRRANQPAKEVIDLTRINQMFERAAQNLKAPKVSFLCPEGDFDITRAKDTSRNPGFLYMKSGATYLGKISPRGEFSPSQDATPDHVSALAMFAADPVKGAAMYGSETGQCCFCRKKLTDGRSVAVGYGPICADNFGLPWGE